MLAVSPGVGCSPAGPGVIIAAVFAATGAPRGLGVSSQTARKDADNLLRRQRDSGQVSYRGRRPVDGDAQRISQLCWLFFLKIIDDQERERELFDDNYVSPIPDGRRWRDWAADPEGITGEGLLDFIKAFISLFINIFDTFFIKLSSLFRHILNKYGLGYEGGTAVALAFVES